MRERPSVRLKRFLVNYPQQMSNDLPFFVDRDQMDDWIPNCHSSSPILAQLSFFLFKYCLSLAHFAFIPFFHSFCLSVSVVEVVVVVLSRRRSVSLAYSCHCSFIFMILCISLAFLSVSSLKMKGAWEKYRQNGLSTLGNIQFSMSYTLRNFF